MAAKMSVLGLILSSYPYLRSAMVWFPLSTSGSGQTENTQIRVFAFSQFDHFPKMKINFESRFEIRMSIFLFSIFLWSVSVSI